MLWFNFPSHHSIPVRNQTNEFLKLGYILTQAYPAASTLEFLTVLQVFESDGEQCIIRLWQNIFIFLILSNELVCLLCVLLRFEFALAYECRLSCGVDRRKSIEKEYWSTMCMCTFAAFSKCWAMGCSVGWVGSNVQSCACPGLDWVYKIIEENLSSRGKLYIRIQIWDNSSHYILQFFSLPGDI